MRRKPSRLSTGRLPLLRLFSTLLAITLTTALPFSVWQESLTSAPANTATVTSAIGLPIADSGIVFTPTAIPVARLRFSRCGISECPNCQIVRVNKRCARRWKPTFSPASAVVVSREELRHGVRTAVSRCLRRPRRRTSRATPPVLKGVGVGRRTGATCTASSSRTKRLTTTSSEGRRHSCCNIPIALTTGS
jgi:hypothetical protein